MIAIGGWGDTVGFTEATKTDAGIAKFASDMQTMLKNTGADGIGMSSFTLVFVSLSSFLFLDSNMGPVWCQHLHADIDWEYPGGNGADYKQVPNSAKVHEIKGFPALLTAVRTAIGPNKLLSIAVPGKRDDMIAFTKDNGPAIWAAVDYINVRISLPSLPSPVQ
jgi:chitinase